MMVLIPFFISYLLGHLAFNLIKGCSTFKPLTQIFLSLGIGMGMSAFLLFTQFFFFNGFSKVGVFGLHIFLIGCLFYGNWALRKKFNWPLISLPKIPLADVVCLVVLLIFFIPVWYQSQFFPMGGWDAWSAWNLKAKFLFANEGHWQQVFDPLLWRASPHYPLLLPLINVWGSILYPQFNSQVPLLTSLIFSFLTIALLFSELKDRTPLALPAAVMILSLPFFTKLASSQYSDIVVAYYLLATLICMVRAKEVQDKVFAILGGILCGFLSFSKPEGLISSGIIIFLGIFYFWQKKQPIRKQILLIYFLTATVITFLPAIAFKLVLSPGNQTFINGLQSGNGLYRLKMIGAFFLMELKSSKWNGIWLILLIGLIMTKFKSIQPVIRIVPLFLLLYVGVVGFYYYLNTYFEIRWWLQVSLNRILFAILPTIIFWVFYCLNEKNEIKKDA